MFLFYTNIKVKDATGNIKYQVQMPSCCMGMCINCMAEGCCNCKIPFYVFTPTSETTGDKAIGKIVKLWRGLGTELFTDAASFQVEFPEEATAADKALLTGTTMYVNILFFEKGQGS